MWPYASYPPRGELLDPWTLAPTRVGLSNVHADTRLNGGKRLQHRSELAVEVVHTHLKGVGQRTILNT